jgi:hypothetical protein
MSVIWLLSSIAYNDFHQIASLRRFAAEAVCKGAMMAETLASETASDIGNT